MKRISLIVISIMIAGLSFADGLKTSKENTTSYSPYPNSGNMVPALNLYAAPSSYNSYVGSISVFASFEIPMIDPNLTIGPEVGLAFGGNDFYGVSSTTFVFNVKGTYYFDWLIPKMPDMFDVFAVGTTGFYLSNYSSGYSHLGLDIGVYAGGRWHFQDNLSVYLLAGVGSSSFGSLGISFKF